MRLSIIDTERCVGCQSCMFACARQNGPASGLGCARIMVHSSNGMENGFKVVVCRACTDAPCAKVCPTGAIKLRKKGGVRIDKAECIGCGNCIEACMLGAIVWDSDDAKPIVCKYCGTCVKFCPHGVLEFAPEEVINA